MAFFCTLQLQEESRIPSHVRQRLRLYSRQPQGKKDYPINYIFVILLLYRMYLDMYMGIFSYILYIWQALRASLLSPYL